MYNVSYNAVAKVLGRPICSVLYERVVHLHIVVFFAPINKLLENS